MVVVLGGSFVNGGGFRGGPVEERRAAAGGHRRCVRGWDLRGDYTGVIRQDDAAEARATTVNQRFSSRNDGSGYEVLLRERWSVADARPDIPEVEIYKGVASSEGRWLETTNHTGCYLWNLNPVGDETVNWRAECSNGLAQGDGWVNWYQRSSLNQIEETSLQGGRRNGSTVVRAADGTLEAEGPYMNGQRHGNWTYVYGDGSCGTSPFVKDELHGTWTVYREGGDVGREVGPYVKGERHGTWTGNDRSGSRLRTIRFENGRRVGGSGSAGDVGAAANLTALRLASPAARSPPGRVP